MLRRQLLSFCCNNSSKCISSPNHFGNSGNEVKQRETSFVSRIPATLGVEAPQPPPDKVSCAHRCSDASLALELLGLEGESRNIHLLPVEFIAAAGSLNGPFNNGTRTTVLDPGECTPSSRLSYQGRGYPGRRHVCLSSVLLSFLYLYELVMATRY